MIAASDADLVTLGQIKSAGIQRDRAGDDADLMTPRRRLGDGRTTFDADLVTAERRLGDASTQTW